jgi:hypothetical protein
LMVLHVLRCSVFVNDAEYGRDRARVILHAIAAFFDRFAEGGLTGTFLFTACAGAQFRPQLSPRPDSNDSETLPLPEFSVLDPTTTDEASIAFGVQPTELVPRTSMADFTRRQHSCCMHTSSGAPRCFQRLRL